MRVHRPRPLNSVPSVSVVIPCYNYGRYLAECVESVKSNSGVDLQIIIVDDASTDDSRNIAANLALSDSRIQIVQHTTNMGHIRTYNDGLDRAEGEYITLVSADDLLTPNSLRRSATLLESFPEVGLVYGLPEYFSGEPGAMWKGIEWWSTWNGAEWLQVIQHRGRNLLVSPEAVVRREVLREIGGYDVAHPHAADLKFWMRAAQIAGVGRINGVQQAWYRIHSENMHTVDFGGTITDYEHVRHVFEDVLRDTSADLTRAKIAMSKEALRLPLITAEGYSQSLGSRVRDFVQETTPELVGSSAWRRFEYRRSRSSHGWVASLHGRATRWRWAYRHFRWRHFGV